MRSFGNLPFRKRIVAMGALVVALVALAAGSAYAYFTATMVSGGNGGAVAASLPSGSTPEASLSGGSVTVTWAQSTVGGQRLGAYAGGGYTVKRYPASGGSGVTPGASCNTTIGGASEKLSCTESNVPPGSWKYTVTPVLNNWVGAESAQSAAVTIIGPPARLAFTPATPGPGTAGETIPNVTVSVEDSAGNVVTSQNSGSVSISIKTGSAQGSFTSGTTTASVSKGVASFTNLVVDTSGSYTFTATPNSISGVTGAVDSGAFTVGAAAASKLAFTTEPSGAVTRNTVFPIQPVVTVEDTFGNRVSTDSSSVTLTLNNPGKVSGASLTCTTNPLTASSGVASFGGCKINKDGATFSLHAADLTLTTADSTNIVVTG